MSNSKLAESNGWPLLRSERGFGKVAIFLAAFSAAMATWCFTIGGFVAYYLKAIPGTYAILAGSLLGILMVVLATLPMCAKYGIDSVVASRAQLGTRGSYVSLILVYASAMGWSTILFIYKGRAISDLLVTFGIMPQQYYGPAVAIIGVLAIFLVLKLIRKGPEYVRSRGPIVAVMVAVMSLVILLLLVQRVGVNGVLDAVAVTPYSDPAGNWASAIEVLVASNLSWWAYTGSIVRTSPSARSSLWPIVIGFGLGVGLGSLTGLYTGVAVQNSGGDPTAFLLSQGGVVVGFVMLAFLVVANVGTAMMGIYAASLAVRQLPKADKFSWKTTIFLVSVPAMLVVALFANSAESFFSVFLAFLGVAFAPICGIQIADWFLLRKQRYDVRSLFVLDKSSKYFYVGGFNIVGFISFAAGIAMYIYLLNPVTYVYQEPFQWITASFPSAVVSGVVYTLGTRIFLAPRGIGGYGRGTASDRPSVKGQRASDESVAGAAASSSVNEAQLTLPSPD
ncbi:purine-cytosine permease family protein [Arthrobacter sp. NyZ413]|uniref:purine-cytosine permease family protein n=1 Tax=Arthrobacter sp. NyZ413 TaxID=3144669 RepID=UPI003BF9059F